MVISSLNRLSITQKVVLRKNSAVLPLPCAIPRCLIIVWGPLARVHTVTAKIESKKRDHYGAPSEPLLALGCKGVVRSKVRYKYMFLGVLGGFPRVHIVDPEGIDAPPLAEAGNHGCACTTNYD